MTKSNNKIPRVFHGQPGKIKKNFFNLLTQPGYPISFPLVRTIGYFWTDSIILAHATPL